MRCPFFIGRGTLYCHYMSKKTQKFAIIDANALIHRAFHALPPLTTRDGQLVNAVLGFSNILIKTIKDIKPTHIAVAFDRKEKTFRHEAYDQYKAHRVKAPDELYEQIPLVKEVLSAFNIPILEIAGYEADDIIGTIARQIYRDQKTTEVIIVTGDNDALQLVNDRTFVLMPHKGISETKLYDSVAVGEKYGGLAPLQLIDYKALSGDTSDNIPGVAGIGPKTAIKLLTDFDSVKNIYAKIDDQKINDRLREKLITYRADAEMSYQLAAIDNAVPIAVDPIDCVLTDFDMQKVIDLFQRLNFKKLLSTVMSLQPVVESKNLFSTNQPKNENMDYHTITTTEQLEKIIAEIKAKKIFALDTETTGLDTLTADLVGMSWSYRAESGCYLPSKIINANKKIIADLLADENVKKVGHNLKYDTVILAQHGLPVAGIYFDTMIASYLLNAGNRQHNLDTLAFVELGYQIQPIEELIGKGKAQISMADVEVEKVSWYACEDADITWRLYEKFHPELEKQAMDGLMHKMEVPLISVLARIEKAGVKIDMDFLKKMSKETGTKIKKIEKKIYDLAGTEFNIGSPAQLKNILFNTLEISTAGISKKKTGLSTAASELEKLQGQHPIIDHIMDYRELTKLKNTYLDALPKLIHPLDGRVHTSFNQTVAATGRLSSSNPNLQNIPIRTDLGHLIRRAFIAEPGYTIVKADYSQIELRIVASLANDENMMAAFSQGVDIHTRTAALINNIPVEEVTPEIRRQAKEVNFGVLYGMGAWGLSQRTGISMTEAQLFIAKYFAAFTGVKKYLDETLVQAREHGYVETLYGRRRAIPDINSNTPAIKNAAERMAVNMPIQGTAADLIKLAMIKLDELLPALSPKSRMILQVHDELVFEVPDADLKKVIPVIRDTMNSVMTLRVPIETEVSAGPNWGETEKQK